MLNLEKPKNQTAEVLYELIQAGFITRRSIMNDLGILNLTARIADLRIRYDIEIKCTRVKAVNKHGRAVIYGLWSIDDIKDIEDTYKSVNS